MVLDNSYSDIALPNLQETPCNVIAFKIKTEPRSQIMSRKRTTIRKAVSPTKASVFELSRALVNNTKAWEEGPKRKSWSIHDLRTIRPLTPAQDDMFHAFINNYDVCGYGTSGTGKSFVALYLALTEVLNERTDIDRIIIVRSTVSTREVGFLKGDLAEKIAPHEACYHQILHEIVGKASTYQDMKDAGIVEFHSTAFLRGLTWDNSIIIVDEIQNMNDEEIDSVMCRTGKNSRVFALGDVKQNDLLYSKRESSGMPWFLRVVENMPEFAMVRFTVHDIVRGPFVKAWIQACELVV